MSATPVEAVPAATVVVVRASSQAPLKALLVKRDDKVAFMAGAFVFPGGRVDPADRQVTVSWNLIATGKSRFSDLTPGTEWPYRVAAARELGEEADVHVNPEDLEPIAHWVTPEGEPRRYDTRFFLCRMPEGQVARYDEKETTALEWFAPSDAIQRCEQGEILLPPPTWTLLKRLGKLGSLDEALAWARAETIVTIQPNLFKTDAQTLLTLPGDPMHAPVQGWQTPEDTRFVLHDGRAWRPIKP